MISKDELVVAQLQVAAYIDPQIQLESLWAMFFFLDDDCLDSSDSKL